MKPALDLPTPFASGSGFVRSGLDKQPDRWLARYRSPVSPTSWLGLTLRVSEDGASDAGQNALAHAT
jgi:hypothetical protein